MASNGPSSGDLEILPEPQQNPEGGARGIFRVIIQTESISTMIHTVSELVGGCID